MKKYSREELLKMDALDVYRVLLAKEISKFPKGFWQRPGSKETAIKCTKFLLEDVLKFSDDDIRENLSVKLFKENGLRGMLDDLFNSSPYKVISEVYPGKYKEWEFSNATPRGYWDDIENGVRATRWLFEEKLNWSDEQIKKELSTQIFKDNGLFGMLKKCFNNSPYQAINAAYPGKFQEWEFDSATPNRLWNDEKNGARATRWLIEEKLKLSDDQLKEQLSSKLFKDNGLGGMLAMCFNNSPYQAISVAYPGKFKPTDFKNKTRNI